MKRTRLLNRIVELAVVTQSDEQQEEDERPESRARHCGDRFRVDDEHQAGTCGIHVIGSGVMIIGQRITVSRLNNPSALYFYSNYLLSLVYRC